MVHGSALLAAAVAENLIGEEDAWGAHRAVEARYDVAPLLPLEDEYRPAFVDAIRAIRATHNNLGSPNWPILLTHSTDAILRLAAKRRRNELGA
jgi:hypothetical protein